MASADLGIAVDDPARIDRIAMLEQIKGAVAAAQASELVQFAKGQVAAQRNARVDYRRLGRGVAEQVGLATRTSPWHGARKLSLARDLALELPAAFALLAAGGISEYVAQLVATETSHLKDATRRVVDQQLVDAGVDQLAPRLLRVWPGAWPTPPTRTVPCGEPGTPGWIGGCRCGRRPTP